MSDFSVPVQYVVGLGTLVVGTAGAIIKWAMDERRDYKSRWERQIIRTAQAAAIPRSPSGPPPLSLPPPSDDWDERSNVRSERELLEQRAMDETLREFVRKMDEIAQREITPTEPAIGRRKMKSVRRGDD